MRKILSISAVLLLFVCGSGTAWADRWHGHGRGHARVYGSVVINPFLGPWYPSGSYYYPPYSPLYSPPYYPPVIAAPAPPPVYIEQDSSGASASPAPQAYWYFCRASNGYYPYTKDCPEGWVKVAPQPPDQH